MVWALAGVVVLAGIGVAAYQLRRAAGAAQDGRADLLAAQGAVEARQLTPAGHDLQRATAAFARMRRALSAPDPLLSLARVVPLARVQVRAVDTMAEVGQRVSQSGARMLKAVSPLLASTNGPAPGCEGPGCAGPSTMSSSSTPMAPPASSPR